MIEFTYKNHRGEIKVRTVKPISLDYMPVPNNEFGYAPGWFLTCEDYTDGRDGEVRSFALTHIQMPEDLFKQPRNDRSFRLMLSTMKRED